MAVLDRHEVGPLRITTYPADHTEGTNPTAVRIEVAGKIVSYTGDGGWTEHVPAVARDADLFITECYAYAKRIRFHMNYPDIREHWNELGAKRVVLTHFSREMMRYQDAIPEECAYDGKQIVL
jgi:ribonuclease BN (tRNA processing enzyme)